jgi:hypothetical protein
LAHQDQRLLPHRRPETNRRSKNRNESGPQLTIRKSKCGLSPNPARTSRIITEFFNTIGRVQMVAPPTTANEYSRLEAVCGQCQLCGRVTSCTPASLRRVQRVTVHAPCRMADARYHPSRIRSLDSRSARLAVSEGPSGCAEPTALSRRQIVAIQSGHSLLAALCQRLRKSEP